MFSRSKLAIVLHANAGGTAVPGRNGEHSGDRLVALAAAVSAYGGTVREQRAGVLVAEFSRVSSAVCAALAARSAEPGPGDAAAAPRIGIALGEVVATEEGVTGDGVVLAQRLGQAAPPGALVVHGAVRGALPARLPLECRDLGGRTLPGFDDPVPAFEVALRPGVPVPDPDPEDAGRDERAAIRLYSSSSRRETYTVLAILLVVGAVSTWRLNRPAPPAEPPAAPAAVEAAPTPVTGSDETTDAEVEADEHPNGNTRPASADPPARP